MTILNPAPGAVQRIAENAHHFEALTERWFTRYGVDLFEAPLGLETVQEGLRQAGYDVVETGLNLGAAVAYQAVGPGTVIGVALEGISTLVDYLQDVGEVSRCGNRIDSNRDRLIQSTRRVCTLLGYPDDSRPEAKKIIFRLYEAVTYWSGTFDAFSRKFSAVYSHAWRAYRGSARFLDLPYQGMTFTDGRTAGVSGIENRFDGTCNQYQIMRAHADRVGTFADALGRIDDVPTRLRMFLLVLGPYLGPFGDPTRGLESIFEPAQGNFSRDDFESTDEGLVVRRSGGVSRGGGGGALPLLLAGGAAAFLLLR